MAAVSHAVFVASEFPLILLLEMHCSLHQQRLVVIALTEDLGAAILSFAELKERGDGAEYLSPVLLKRRVLVKGIVHKAKQPQSATESPQAAGRRLTPRFEARRKFSQGIKIMAERRSLRQSRQKPSVDAEKGWDPHVAPRVSAVLKSDSSADLFGGEVP
eukprot:7380912-Prymnesium_polylepis.2